MVIETGLYDFHKICITVLKLYYSKQKRSIIHYCKFKDFINDSFTKDVQTLVTKSVNKKTDSFQALRHFIC